MLAVSCARGGEPASAPAARPEPAPARPPLSELDALEHDLAQSESQLRRVLAQRFSEGDAAREEAAPPLPSAAGAPPRPAPAPESPASAGAAAEPEGEATSAAPGRVGSNCDLACRALSSMRRSADGICAITGREDARCQVAQQRVEDARARVEGAGCTCR